jgi:hypothetical protein
MVITNPEGMEVGHVAGKASLSTGDPVLEALWNDLKKRMPGTGPGWFENVRKELSAHGYDLDLLT